MKSRREILKAHYINLLKSTARWGGLVSITLSALFLPVQVGAQQIPIRSTTLGSSLISANTTYDFSFRPAQGVLTRAVMFQVCTSPLELTSCSTPTGFSLTAPGATFTAGSSTAPFNANWATGTGGLVPTANSFWITYGTGSTLSNSTTYTVRLTNVHNPSTTNATFYTRVYTYSDVLATTPNQIDFGAAAVSTANQVTVSANVQESLTFCVYTLANCAAGGSTVSLGTGGDNVLSTTDPSGGVSKMDASTNAQTGYIITYITTSPGGTGGSTCAGSLSSTNDCITDAGASAVGPPADGVAMFGINLKLNTTALTPAGAIGANQTGGTGTPIAPYATADQIAFQAGLTPRTVANTTSAPSVTTTYTVSYVAQAGSTTKPGAYSATFTWVCTGTF